VRLKPLLLDPSYAVTAVTLVPCPVFIRFLSSVSRRRHLSLLVLNPASVDC